MKLKEHNCLSFEWREIYSNRYNVAIMSFEWREIYLKRYNVAIMQQ